MQIRSPLLVLSSDSEFSERITSFLFFFRFPLFNKKAKRTEKKRKRKSLFIKMDPDWRRRNQPFPAHAAIEIGITGLEEKEQQKEERASF